MKVELGCASGSKTCTNRVAVECTKSRTTNLSLRRVSWSLFNHSLGAEYFDEVASWLKAHSFSRYGEMCRQKHVTLLKELPLKITRADVKKVK